MGPGGGWGLAQEQDKEQQQQQQAQDWCRDQRVLSDPGGGNETVSAQGRAQGSLCAMMSDHQPRLGEGLGLT